MKEFLGKSEGYTPLESYDAFAALQVCIPNCPFSMSLDMGFMSEFNKK